MHTHTHTHTHTDTHTPRAHTHTLTHFKLGFSNSNAFILGTAEPVTVC